MENSGENPSFIHLLPDDVLWLIIRSAIIDRYSNNNHSNSDPSDWVTFCKTGFVGDILRVCPQFMRCILKRTTYTGKVNLCGKMLDSFMFKPGVMKLKYV